MSKPEQVGVAQPNDMEQPEQTKQQRPGGKQKSKPKDDEELPGADGQLSAGANEDTYD